jgi:hypothetical protein
MKYLHLLVFFLTVGVHVVAQKESENLFILISQPLFQVDYVSPTADKPQSKLWFMSGYWWAILPRSAGPSLWQRTDEGWVEHTKVTKALRGVPGQVDVWADDQKVTAVGVDDDSLTVFQLIRRKKSSVLRWKVRILAELFPPSGKYPLETATIVQDGGGAWWVAAIADGKVCVWHCSAKKAKLELSFCPGNRDRSG